VPSPQAVALYVRPPLATWVTKPLRGGMKFAEAETELAWGKTLGVRGGHGDRERARSLLERARDTAITQAYARVERQATAALSDLV
jgi:hypothetical protein